RESMQQQERRSDAHGFQMHERQAGVHQEPRCAISCKAASSWSISSAECAEESEMRRRALPWGTLGGRIAGTHRPRSNKASDNATVAALGPMISGWIAVGDGASVHGNARAP